MPAHLRIAADAAPASSREQACYGRALGKGRVHLASLLNWWMAQSSWSHNGMGAIADWATGERKWLSSPQLSHIRNANVKQVGFQNLLALGAVNQAVHCWKEQGERDAVRRYGPFSRHGVTEDLMHGSIWLKHPDHGAPLVFHDFCDVFVGLLEIPYVSEVVISPHETRALTEEIAHLLDRLTAQTGLGLRAGMAEILRHYPISDPDRVARLEAVILGRHIYTQAECEEELFALSQLVADMRGLPRGTYGPRDFYAELSSDRRRT